ncbi:MAG: ATP-binding protein [Bacteroidota bacterium]|nr:ATP-binding protein [Bacteroidota bacterium]
MAITGPESTGKSALAKALAEHFDTVWVPEYAREYIDGLDRPYRFEDIETIAKGQLRREEEMVKHANRVLFCDTDIVVTKIWSDFGYGKCSEWINSNVKNHVYDLYLLTNLDIPWVFDPQREHPSQREKLFEIYKKELDFNSFNYKIVKGIDKVRLQNAIGYVNSLLTV